MVSFKKNIALSPIKANRLFWMGRYAERVYLALHLLRKHYDLMIDEDRNAYKSFCYKMGIMDRYESPEHFMKSYLYDANNPDSVFNMLITVSDNAILIREEITSETLSYIQMADDYMKSCKERSTRLGGLQYLTDCILAFWGSADERICTPTIRKTIFFGKFVESSDMHIRFGYPLDRISSSFARMKEYMDGIPDLFNNVQIQAFEEQLTEEKYKENKTLAYLNAIFTA